MKQLTQVWKDTPLLQHQFEYGKIEQEAKGTCEVRCGYEKDNIDFGNYLLDFNICRRWICSCKSRTGECRLCSHSCVMDYDMLWILSAQAK